MSVIRRPVSCMAVINNSRTQLMDSSSGGAFSILAESVLSEGGVVYGHAFSDGLKVRCIRVDSVEEVARLRGSKYVQSDMGYAMRNVKEDLMSGKRVLFSGTPCQVDGLLSFLGGFSKGLITVDIVCHGVPSAEFFLACMSQEFGDSLMEVKFRDKEEGWVASGTAVIRRFGKLAKVPFSPRTSLYYQLFLSGSTYRECCYRCPYAGGGRPGDLTLGDFWGLDTDDAGLDDSHGVSIVMANTETGMHALDEIKKFSTWVERPLEEATRGNDQLRHPTLRPCERDVVLERWKNEGIVALERSYKKASLISSTRWRIKRKIRHAFLALSKGWK